MLNPEDTIRLELDFGQSSQRAGEVSQSVKTVETTTQEATSAFRVIKAETDALEKELAQLNKQFRDGKVDLETYTLRAESLRGGIAEGKRIVGEATGEFRAFGGGLLNVSYAVQDFTSQLGTRGLLGGLAAVQNNIPPILVGLGAGPGLAGVVSIAAVAVGGLASALTATSTKAKEADDALKEVEKTAARIGQLRKPEQERAEKDVMGGLQAMGGPDVARGIEMAIRAEVEPSLKLVRGTPVEADIEEFIKTQAQQITGGLPRSRAAQQEALRLARQFPGFFPGGRGFAGRFEEMLAGGERMPKLAEEEARAEAEAGKAWRKDREAAVKEGAPGDEMVKLFHRDQERERERAAKEGAPGDEMVKLFRRDRERRRERAAKEGPRGIAEARAELARADRLIDETSEKFGDRFAIENEINLRSGGEAPISAIKAAGQRTMDLMARGLNVNDAIMQAMAEQGRKMAELEARITGQEQFIRQLRQQQQHHNMNMSRTR